MTKRPTRTRTTTKAQHAHSFVVYVSYPTSSKEYAYLCNQPGIVQGAKLLMNGTTVTVVRTAQSDPLATKWITSPVVETARARRKEIADALVEIERRELFIARMKKLRSPEAKRLIREYVNLEH